MTHYTGAVPESASVADWRDLAACRETNGSGKPLHDPELFFPAGETGAALGQAEEAKRACARCPVIDACLQYALQQQIEHGVWGGLTERERREMRRRSARYRQPVPKSAPKLIFDRTASLPDACRDLYHRYTEQRGKHIVWTSPHTQVSIDSQDRTYSQISFQAGHGRWPEGTVKRACPVWRCVAPACLTDKAIRAARNQATAGGTS